MNKIYIYLVLSCLCVACSSNDKTRIPYDFDQLQLHLGDNIDQSTKIAWKWDHMSSTHAAPETGGIEYYVNLEQPYFEYNGEETLPSLAIVTNKQNIENFSATVLFVLKDYKKETITELFTQLKMFELLEDENVRNALLDASVYTESKILYDQFLSLELADMEGGYSSMHYSISSK